ncbi:MAG: hypothetical protein V4548_07845 [Bacteroidota bacterium]
MKKVFLYFQFEKSYGIVTNYELRSTGRTYARGKVYYSEAVSPSIEVYFNKKKL